MLVVFRATYVALCVFLPFFSLLQLHHSYNIICSSCIRSREDIGVCAVCLVAAPVGLGGGGAGGTKCAASLAFNFAPIIFY